MAPHHHDGIAEVKLFLQRERPTVKERKRVGRKPEVIVFEDELDVQDRGDDRRDARPCLGQVHFRVDEGSRRQHRDAHDEQRRCDAGDSTLIEVRQRERAGQQFAMDDPCDQVSR